MKRIVFIITVAAVGLVLAAAAACRQTREVQRAVAKTAPAVGYMPKAVIYKTSGDFFDRVPITMNRERTKVVSYPAPTDIYPGAMPVRLADGWLLDRRGIGENAVFTRWTYNEYAALSEPPTLAELKSAVIPGSRVTEIRRLPMFTSEAASDTAAVNRLIVDSLATLPVVYSTR